MKINNIGRTNMNPYNKQMDKMEKAQNVTKRDKIEISSEALNLQKGNPLEMERQQKVEKLKEEVQSGKYEINAKEVAKKMYEFWNK
ncbi:flagellar biosynthesis anti-sigma factor FlgM [Cytobacillus sp. NCCP-133]|uniref:flagellar biosynthesis anti-sigma factor FlgM n=1 Tax=Cytobacillus sp. NCCP-133 TaxID=766848 RepID=UPI002232BF76|nr:flagellar biosynthesis anti-sigma factor FlgM [Cytobacillus sp. NCCP-133]GLB60195.1 negative regulator of flagellin synthesis [Cytobacillus sp. NCCP-133]